MNLKLILCFLVTFLCLEAYSQKRPGNSDVKKALDDGLYINTKNLVRFRLAPLFNNYVGLSIERKLTPSFGLEGGLYKKLGNLSPYELRRMAYSDVSVKSTNSGFGFMLYPKLYTRNKYINNGVFYGFKYMKQFYKSQIEVEQYDNVNGNYLETQKVNSVYTNYALTFGFHTQIASRFTLGIEGGPCVYFDKYKKVNRKETDFLNNTKVEVKDYFNGGLFYLVDVSLGFLL
ncbi:MAG TPA: hypothetical protein VGF79_10275 [Bacteroidia bacterium]